MVTRVRMEDPRKVVVITGSITLLQGCFSGMDQPQGFLALQIGKWRERLKPEKLCNQMKVLTTMN